MATTHCRAVLIMHVSARTVSDPNVSLAFTRQCTGHFTVFGLVLSLSGITMCTHMRQGVITNLPCIFTCPEIFSIIIILKQKGVMQMNRLADV